MKTTCLWRPRHLRPANIINIMCPSLVGSLYMANQLCKGPWHVHFSCQRTTPDGNREATEKVTAGMYNGMCRIAEVGKTVTGC